MDRRAQDELLEVLDLLRQQVEPGNLIVPLGSIRYQPSAVVVSGFLYPMGLIARVFADPEIGHADLISPKVLVCKEALTENAQLRYGIAPVIEQLMSSKVHRSLALFAPDLDDVVLEALVTAHRRKLCTIAAICCIGMEHAEAEHYLHSLARMCGATVVGSAARDGPAWTEALGDARRILADRRRTVIIEPSRIEQADIAPLPIGLLSVGGNDASDVLEGVEWVEGLLGQ